jgi:hypothetical protein
MPEIDTRKSPWNWGIPIEDTFVDRELYRLVTIFAASSFLSEKRGDEDEANLFGYCLRYFELPEVGRILISLAAILRNEWDYRPDSINEHLDYVAQNPKVGLLTEDLENPNNQCDLHVRESLNKIMHAHMMNFERSEGSSVYSGHLLPRVHLYGEKKGKEWKATIDIYTWAEVIHALC